jgi:hypothetical protein
MDPGDAVHDTVELTGTFSAIAETDAVEAPFARRTCGLGAETVMVEASS